MQENRVLINRFARQMNCFVVTANSTLATPSDDDDDDDSEEDDSSEADDEGSKVYKNPRNSPSTLCPRDEEQATLLVTYRLVVTSKNVRAFFVLFVWIEI